jgi:hypothetical protein
MNAEERALEAIRMTRDVLDHALDNGLTLAYMAANDVDPDDVEDTVTEILEYLDKTGEEESEPERH